MALYRPSLECEVLFGDLRSSIENSLAMTTSVNFTEKKPSSRGFKPRWKKKCFVCQKEGCWSTNHTDEERKTARAQFFSMLYFTGAPPPKDFSVHLAEYEGIEHTSQYN
ncbi:hypothetical protein L13192_00905 [Pyrenophora tritici-repentis]|nr:hypothetical protein L13192_00905 [Pyrenophora tritici-repentis]